MDLLSRILSGFRQKRVPRGIFGHLVNHSAPDMTGVERLVAYKGWVYTNLRATASASRLRLVNPSRPQSSTRR